MLKVEEPGCKCGPAREKRRRDAGGTTYEGTQEERWHLGYSWRGGVGTLSAGDGVPFKTMVRTWFNARTGMVRRSIEANILNFWWGR